MKLIHTVILALLIGYLSGCSTIKAFKLMKCGRVSPAVFKIEVPFEMRLGLIVLKVKIHGHEYSFVLDTGAPCVISKELAQALGINPAGKTKSSDSQGNTGHIGIAAIDSIGIGDLLFLNTGAAIGDLTQSAEIACYHVDGLIGANLMRKAFWQFDYVRHIITITSNRDSLDIPANARHIHFKQSGVGIPLIDVQLNGQTDRNVTVDLGSTGDFCSSAGVYDRLKNEGLRACAYNYGTGPSSGLYGRGKEDTTWYAVIPSIWLDSLQLSNQVVSFSKKRAKTIGTQFFKNYRLIFDWSSNELTMVPVSTYCNTCEKSYKFTLLYRNSQIFVGSVYVTGNEANDGLQIGDQVLEIDGKDYRNCSADSYCSLIRQRFENSADHVSLLVKRGDRELNFKFAKEALFINK